MNAVIPVILLSLLLTTRAQTTCQNMAAFKAGGCDLPSDYCSNHKQECAEFYAPLVKFHPDEIFWPDSVDTYIANSFLGRYEFKEKCANLLVTKMCVNDLEVKVIRENVQKSDLTADAPFNPSTGTGVLDNTIFLIPKDKVDSGHSFLHNRGLPSYVIGTEPGQVPIYARYKQSGNRMEIQYNIYFPFNGGKQIGFQRLGNHFGDWEDISVLLVDSKITRVYVHAHGSSNAYDWSFGDPQIQKVDQYHPVIFMAHASHGSYFIPGVDPYKDVLGINILQDVSADGGTEWRTWENVQDMTWEFKGRWGTRHDHYGSKSGTCVLSKKGGDLDKLTDGPTDPNNNGKSSGFKWL